MITLTAVALVLVMAAAYVAYVRVHDCDVPGRTCCGPDSEVQTRHCHHGLGCNISTGTCAACGVPGQPCCDGDFTGFSLKGYNGFLLDPLERIDSCNAGATCDARLAPDGKSWLGTRTCLGCGTKEGGSCCAPDVRYALGRCFTDAASGTRLVCNDPWAREQGQCIPCGRRAGEIACLDGYPCDEGMSEQDGVCVICGFPGTPVCDRGEPCPHQAAPNKSYTMCVPAGGPNQPCMSGGRCEYLGTFCNSRGTCEPCGDGGQPCCPPGRGDACNIGECRDGRCFACGYANMPVCSGDSPCQGGLEPVEGFCRPCGKAWQPCCYGISIRCEDGMRCKDRTCQGPTGGAGSKEDWRTCSGEPWGWSTVAHVVWVEDANDCAFTTNVIANSPAEAMQCARNNHGENAIDTPIETMTFSVTCPTTGCNQQTRNGRDQDAMESCLEYEFPNCEIEAGPCQ